MIRLFLLTAALCAFAGWGINTVAQAVLAAQTMEGR